MITRQEALELFHRHVKNEKMIFHCLASEVVKRKNILEGGKIGIPIDRFAEIAILSLLPIAGEIGL